MYKKLIYGVLLLLTIASCSESSEQEDEYANWKERNDVFSKVYFSRLIQQLMLEVIIGKLYVIGLFKSSLEYRKKIIS